MGKIEEYEPRHFTELVELFAEHGSVARRALNDYSYEDLGNRLRSPGVATYCYFNDDNVMDSFISSTALTSLPSWVVRLVCGRKSNLFNPVKVGICELYNTTITHWESKGYTNFFYVQPDIFLKSGNTRTREGSVKLQEYIPHTYITVAANTESEYPLIRGIMGPGTFGENMCVRWCFKQ